MILKSPRRRLGLALVLAFTCVVGTAHAKNLDSLKQVSMEPGLALAEVHLELAEASTDRALYSDALVECEQAWNCSKHGSANIRLDGGVRKGRLARCSPQNATKKGCLCNHDVGNGACANGRLDALDYHQEHVRASLAMIAADFELGAEATSGDRIAEGAIREVKDNTLSLTTTAVWFISTREYPLAIEYMKKALDCLPANGNQQFQAIMNQNLAWLHMKTEEFDVAHHHLNVVEDLASELDFTVLVQFAHDMRCDSPAARGFGFRSGVQKCGDRIQ